MFATRRKEEGEDSKESDLAILDGCRYDLLLRGPKEGAVLEERLKNAIEHSIGDVKK